MTRIQKTWGCNCTLYFIFDVLKVRINLLELPHKQLSIKSTNQWTTTISLRIAVHFMDTFNTLTIIFSIYTRLSILPYQDQYPIIPLTEIILLIIWQESHFHSG